jgi:hypothetical protein
VGDMIKKHWDLFMAAAQKPILVNLLNRMGNFETDADSNGMADGWKSLLASVPVKSMVNNIQSVTPTARYQALSAQNLPFGVGDKVYACVWMRTAGGLNSAYQSIIGVETLYGGSGNFEFLSGLSTATATTHNYDVITSKLASDWVAIEVKLAYVFNLTKVFGAGKEPTKTAMDAFMQAQTEYFVNKEYILVA